MLLLCSDLKPTLYLDIRWHLKRGLQTGEAVVFDNESRLINTNDVCRIEFIVAASL